MERASKAILTAFLLLLVINVIKGSGRRWLGFVFTGTDLNPSLSPKQLGRGQHGEKVKPGGQTWFGGIPDTNT